MRPGLWVISVAGLACLAAARGPVVHAEAPRRGGVALPEDRSPRIEWRDDWRATYTLNRERWQKDLKRRVEDEKIREGRLCVRTLSLLDALRKRFPDKAGELTSTYAEALGRLFALGLGDVGRQEFERAAAGDAGQAAAVASRVLESARWHQGSPYSLSGSRELVELAARRLAALDEAGRLGDGREAMVAAWRALGVLARLRGDLLEAAAMLERVPAAKRDAWWQFEKAVLYSAAGRDEAALPRFQAAAKATREYHAGRLAKLIPDSEGAPKPGYLDATGLRDTWRRLRPRSLEESQDALEELIAEAAGADTLIACGDDRRTSIWRSVDRSVREREPAKLASLREAQAAKARRQLGAARTLGAAGALRLFRRHPWASPAHEALLASAEAALERGHGGLALRSFQDILAHAADPGLLAKAQVGLWVALAQDRRRRRRFEASFEGIRPDSRYPWAGGRETAAGIRRRLLAGGEAEPAAPAAPALAELRRQTLHAPAVQGWPSELLGSIPSALRARVPAPSSGLVAGDGGVVVAAPRLLACFGDATLPKWQRTPVAFARLPGHGSSEQGRLLTVPGVFLPALLDGRIYTRWGLDPTHRYLTALAAFDAGTGRMLWSTSGAAAWRDLQPVSDPAVAEGRVYVLAASRELSLIRSTKRLVLVCLDAGDGALLWRRLLARQTFAVPHAGQWGLGAGQLVDVAHYGNAVTVCDGEVYCQSNAGFVACCDARDGLVEWAYDTPRARLAAGLTRVVRRQGASPIVAGERVLFVPRDQQGAFALDRATGKLLWDQPFVPSEDAVGLAGDLLVLHDSRHVAALDVATGRARWARRFDEGIVGRPRLAGSMVYLGTRAGLHRIAAETGKTLEQAAWGESGPLPFVVRGRSLLGLTHEPPAGKHPAVGKPLSPRAPKASSPLRLPLKHVWELVRPNPRLFVPPAEAKAKDRLYLLSQDVLECVAATPQGAVLWRRPIPPGPERVAWADKLLLAVYARRVVALDALSGRLRWDTETPFMMRRFRVAGRFGIFANFRQNDNHGRSVGAIDLASGKVLWHSGFPRYGSVWSSYFHAIGWDGASVHLIGYLAHEKLRGHYDLVCRPTDGRVAAARPLVKNRKLDVVSLALDRRFGFLIDKSGELYRFGLQGAPSVVRWPRKFIYANDWRGLAGFELCGPWLRMVLHNSRPPPTQWHWVLRPDDTAYGCERPRRGVVRGDRLFEHHGQTVAVLDLRRKQVGMRYHVPPGRDAWPSAFDSHEQGDTMFVVSARVPPDGAKRLMPLQIDAFDRGSGAHRAGQTLDGVVCWREGGHANRTQVVWRDGAVFATDLRGLHALVPAPAGEEPPGEARRVAYRARRPMRLDGALDDWAGHAPFALEGDGGTAGKLRIAHDPTRLYLAVSCPCESVVPRRGRGHAGSGDWLEVGLTTGTGQSVRSYRWGLGLNDHGRAVCEPLPPARMPAGVQGAGRQALDGRQFAYEVAVPLASVLSKEQIGRPQTVGLSLTVWQDRLGRGPTRRFTWGRALLGRQTLPVGHENVVLHPLTHKQFDAGLALVRQLPDLAESWRFVLRHVLPLHGSSRRAVERIFRDLVARVPGSTLTERLLPVLHRALRTSPNDDPTPTLLRLAEAAGVPPAVRRRHARLARCYLSQWVSIDPEKPPATLYLHLRAGHYRSGSGHVAFWGRDGRYLRSRTSGASRRYFGPVPRGGAWQELRVPLMRVGIDRQPILGLYFGQVGGGRVLWDRTALVVDGRERIVLDDEPPRGKQDGGWQWHGGRVKSGRRAHANAPPSRSGYPAGHGISSLEAPLVGHVLPPATGGYISQWVYLDPAKPPTYVGIAPRDISGRSVRVVWGMAVSRAMYLGPLPKPGVWTELRLPLAGTDVGHTPIDGFAFEHKDGQAFWDRTALVAGGREKVVIDDALPEGSSHNSRWKWVDRPVKSGTKAHVYSHAPRSGSQAVQFPKTPLVDHLPFDRARAIDTLKAHIPKLGPTDDAWRFFEEMLRLDLPDTPRRIEHAAWFVKAIPDHPRVPALLGHLVEWHRATGSKTPEKTVDALAVSAGVPRETLYQFRRAHRVARGAFVRTWQVIGPFANPGSKGYDKAYLPEGEPIHLDRKHAGIGGEVIWRPHKSPTDFVDFTKLFKPSEYVVAYAACWVYSNRGQSAVFELGSDDGFKLWLNGKLIGGKLIARPAAPGQDVLPVTLSRGWNEVLVKVESGTSEWGFYLEIVDREARDLLKHLKIATPPPPSRRE